MNIKPLIIFGHEFKNYRIMDLSTKEYGCMSFLKVDRNNATEIARSKSIKQEHLENIEDKNFITMFFAEHCFKNIRCDFCGEEHLAIYMSKTEEGMVCTFCIDKSKPKIEFVTLELENYVLDKNNATQRC